MSVSSRKRAREMALQLLFSLDLLESDDVKGAIKYFPCNEDESVMAYVEKLLDGVWGRRFEIDELIKEYVVGWKTERMSYVDRNAIRLAIWEGMLENTAPLPVAINEAVELAKRFGTEDSPRFVNGVLGRIVRMREGKNTPDGESDSSCL